MAFATGLGNKLDDGAVLQVETALHVQLSFNQAASVSTQIATLRSLLLGGARGDLGIQVDAVVQVSPIRWVKSARIQFVQGTRPLVVEVQNADIMASLILLKKEVEAKTGATIRMTFTGATEAHLIAEKIGKAGVGVVLSPVRPFPVDWERRRM